MGVGAVCGVILKGSQVENQLLFLGGARGPCPKAGPLCVYLEITKSNGSWSLLTGDPGSVQFVSFTA